MDKLIALFILLIILVALAAGLLYLWADVTDSAADYETARGHAEAEITRAQGQAALDRAEARATVIQAAALASQITAQASITQMYAALPWGVLAVVGLLGLGMLGLVVLVIAFRLQAGPPVIQQQVYILPRGGQRLALPAPTDRQDIIIYQPEEERER